MIKENVFHFQLIKIISITRALQAMFLRTNVGNIIDLKLLMMGQHNGSRLAPANSRARESQRETALG